MIRAIVTDIEGTTSSLSFVKDVLFPYAAEKLPDYVRAHADEPEVRALLDEAAEIGRVAHEDAAVIDLMLEWIRQDQKITPLKALQGLIWEDGYRKGDFTGHVYADAVDAMQAWHAQGIRLYVYSSGSIKAQRLLFGYTALGDLTPLFSGYFDTTIGHKREVMSYETIRDALGFPSEDILFLSDIREELDAARDAGFHTLCLVRDGDTSVDVGHPAVADFAAIDLAQFVS